MIGCECWTQTCDIPVTLKLETPPGSWHFSKRTLLGVGLQRASGSSGPLNPQPTLKPKVSNVVLFWFFKVNIFPLAMIVMQFCVRPQKETSLEV